MIRYFYVLFFIFVSSVSAQTIGPVVQMKPTFSIGVLDLQMHSGDLFYVKPTQANINYLSQFWTVSVSSDQKYLSLATLQCVAIT